MLATYNSLTHMSSCVTGSEVWGTEDCKLVVTCIQEIAECLQQNAKSEKATAFLIWKALLFSVVALTTISEHLHHRIYFTVANILQSPVEMQLIS